MRPREAFRYYFIAVTAIVCRIAAQSGYPIETITFTGADYPAAVLLTVSGLHAPMPFSEAALRDAAQRIESTGFFRSVQFHYEPAPDRKGYAVHFELTEDKDSLPGRIDLPGIDEDAVWMAIQAADPLLTRQVPSSDIAQARYIQGIEAYAAQNGKSQKVAARVNGGEIGDRRPSMVFEPEELKIIAAVRFIDTYALKPADLEAVLEPIAVNSGYTESRFRQLLDLNVRPIYEEHGYLGVVFDHLRLREDDSGHLTVETHVIDGRVYTLRNVTLDGPGIPEAEMRQAAGFHTGEPANWKLFLESVSDAERVLKRRGYIAVRSRVERNLNSHEGAADVIVHVTPGPQYRFGRLRLSGLPDDLQSRAERMWTLRTGQPLDGEYPDEFLRSVIKELRPPKFKLSRSLPPGDGENVLDVVIAFRPATE
jgi:outer membrane protein insertion porin family